MSDQVFERPAKEEASGSPYTRKAMHFAQHMRRKEQIADALEAVGEYKAAAALRECHTTEHLTGCSHCGASWWVVTRCRSRICPICSYKTSQVRAGLIQSMIEGLRHPKFVTLTMPRWTDDPGDGIKYIREAFTRLRRTGGIPGLEGGAYSVEVVPKPDGWHIHMHLILDCDYIAQKRLMAAWGRAIGVQSPSVDVRDAGGTQAAKYVAKYVTKSLNPKDGPEAYARLYQAIHGLRLFSLFGKWYKSASMIEALRDSQKHVQCRCPKCGELGTLFDVRCGRFVFGQEWDSVRQFWESKQFGASRKRSDMMSLGKDDAYEDEPIIPAEYDWTEDFEDSPSLP